MIDLALGVGGAFSEWFATPMLGAAVGVRPVPAFELQLSGAYAPPSLGRFTAAGRQDLDCFCSGTIERAGAVVTFTAGILPLRERVGAWDVEVGLRVGGGALLDRPAYEADVEGTPVDWLDHTPRLFPALTVEAVAGAQHGRFGVRLRLERLQWVSTGWDARSGEVLLPRVEAVVRW
jgi:hypothetical protein